MVGLLVVVIVIALIVVLAQRRRGESEERMPLRGGRAAAPRPRATDLEARLAGWTEQGLLSADQAAAILAAETRAAEEAPKRVSMVGEILGYIGGALAIIGGALLVARFWDDLSTAGRLTILGSGAAAFLVAGALVKEEADPALWRLRGFLWLLSSGATAGFAALAAVDVFDLTEERIALVTGATVAVQSAALWQLRDRPLQHVSTLGGLVAAALAAVAWVTTQGPMGLTLWVIGGFWAWAGWRRWVPPSVVARLLGPLIMLFGASVVAGQWAGAAPLIGLATAFGLVGAGTMVGEFLFTGVGLAGVFAFVPWTVAYFFGDVLGVPVVVMVSGVLLLGVGLVILRRGMRVGGPHEHGRPVGREAEHRRAA